LKLKFQTVAEKTAKNFGGGATLFCRTWYNSRAADRRRDADSHIHTVWQ